MLSPQIPTRDRLIGALMRKERDGVSGANLGKLVAEGEGWRVLDIICTAGPHDRSFEERHAWMSISMVVSGIFAYRSDRGSSLMSSGAMVLGSFGRNFERSHKHGEGDRCVSFQFDQGLFESIARDAGASRAGFHRDRMPPLRAFASLAARIATAIDHPTTFEEIGLELAGAVIRVDDERAHNASTVASRDATCIADVMRYLEARFGEPHTLDDLASIARLSRYHFLRTFKRVTGITPHQWVLRARLREAARRIATSREPITEIALDVGFDDLSNFIRTFRAEFGSSPGRYRIRG